MTEARRFSPILAAADAGAVASAAHDLRNGGLLGLPTETVYGLAADADNPDAVAAIFAAKGRPANHPLIVHVAAFDGGMSGVQHYAQDVPAFARQLMAAFWPGPLTLIVPRRPAVASAAAGGQDSIGLRCPAHPVAQALLATLRQPTAGEAVVWGLAAPSANRFGRVSPTQAVHVQSEFADNAHSLPGGHLCILDGGDCDVGIESTIIDCTRGAPVLLRPGAISSADVAAACGQPLVAADSLRALGRPAPRASGTLASHYAPSARVRLIDGEALAQALREWTPLNNASDDKPRAVSLAVYARMALPKPPAQTVLQPMPQDAAAAAHELFAVLRALDALGVDQIWVETPPAGVAWDGVRDRLQRAAA